MLETLTQGFTAAQEKLRGVTKITEENIEEALRDVRMSLLEADVDFVVVKDFLARVKERALGEKVETRVRATDGRKLKLTPGQHFVAICEEELTQLMGPVDATLKHGAGGLLSIMLLGLQGVGKTTIAAKLARHLQKEGKRPLLVAADIYRPAAVLQLQKLGESIGVPVHSGAPGELPPTICAHAVEQAKIRGCDAIIFDTAGRLTLDDALMQELEEIKARTAPANTLLVCDALMGRDAVNVAKAFRERIPLDGLILTKLDGDARGGAALAIKAVTGVPIKFLGTGETVDKLEAFRPEGLASRILGMGDIVGLVQDFEEVLDEKQAEQDAERLLSGEFGFDDFLTQIKTLQKMGSLKDLIAKLPGMGALANQVDERELVKVQAMIHSMTREERQQPSVIDTSRIRRISRGSGRKEGEVRDLLTRFHQMRKMMSMLGGGGGMLSKIPGLGKLGGAGGMGDFDPAALFGGAGGLGGLAGLGGGFGGGPPKPTKAPLTAAQKNKMKRKRKQQKKDRKRKK